MNQKTLKSISKGVILGIIIVAIYFASQVSSIELKRTESTLANFKNLDSYNFELNLSLTESREGFYDLSVAGYLNNENKLAQGIFVLDTRIEGAIQEIEGSFVYDYPNLYLLLEDDGLPITLEPFFVDNYGWEIEEVRGSWMQINIEKDLLSLFSLDKKEISVISEDKKIQEKEMYHYQTKISEGLGFFTDSIDSEIFLGKEDLNLYRVIVEDNVKLAEDFLAHEPFSSFSKGSEPKLSLRIDFFGFNTQEEIEIPENFIEIK